MTANYRATPEQWEWISGIPTAAEACILELRARVEALEAAQQPATCPHIVSSDEGTSYCRLAEQGAAPATEDSSVPAPTGSLVERVAKAVADADERIPLDGSVNIWSPEARAAILTAATWLREHGHVSAASALEQEVGQC